MLYALFAMKSVAVSRPLLRNFVHRLNPHSNLDSDISSPNRNSYDDYLLEKGWTICSYDANTYFVNAL